MKTVDWGLEDGLEILECDGLSMEKDGNSVKHAGLWDPVEEDWNFH